MHKVSTKKTAWLAGSLLAAGVTTVLLSLAAGPSTLPAGQPPAQPWDMYLFGGPGDQYGLAIVVQGNQVIVGGYNALLRSYSIPMSSIPQWHLAEPVPTYKVTSSLTATTSHIYAAGDAYPPTCGASDGVGGTEIKCMFAKYLLDGSPIFCGSYNFFPYRGYEMYYAAAASNEAGADYIYAGGTAEQMGGGYSGPFILAKYDANGSMVNKATEPGVGWGYPPFRLGVSTAWGLMVLNGHLYVAGQSWLPYYDEDQDQTWDFWGQRPVLMKYDFGLTREWKYRANIAAGYAGYSGQFYAVTTLDNYLYAAGRGYPTGGSQGYDFLVEKFDEDGNRIWSASWGEPYEDALRGIVAVGNRLFAVGYTYKTAHSSDRDGDADVVIYEIHPDGSYQLVETIGGSRVDFSYGTATDGHDLYIVGQTTSFASDEGNVPGSFEIMLIHYRLNRPPVADDQSVNANGGVALNIDLTASDEDNDDLMYTVESGPSHGALSGTAPNLIYTALSSYWGPDEFTFKANDGTEDSSVATVTIAVNHIPVAIGQSVDTDENVSAAIRLGAATDVDGDELIHTVLSGPSHGVLTGSAPNLTYAPASNYYGPDSFTFQINDGKALSNIATVLITVKRVFSFSGFIQPIDNIPVVNNARAGSTIPVKWRITDLDGTPISDPESFNNLTSLNIACETLTGDSTDEVETYAGGSGLQYFGNGNWQFNWKTPKSYLNQCRKMVLTLADGRTYAAHFRFR